MNTEGKNLPFFVCLNRPISRVPVFPDIICLLSSKSLSQVMTKLHLSEYPVFFKKVNTRHLS